ncbi:1-aminocyclopropane-1-carboxylate oxidase-like [Phragmites australis]|uniref:1-aminocyclopropane-1-carboxylate oxidase-like n=1 Tax=Phragmites australis TaxID=29695 RepID=UPI002D766874|nr:1-aminocyclopropane-1-carboxylate oxidase-like [Phragmites australis]
MAASASSSTAATVMSGPNSGRSVLPGPPPPTPSNHHALPSSAAAGGTDAALSAFLHRRLLSSPAPPLRSPPYVRSQAPHSLPPLVSLDSPDPRALRDAADAGYFHLVGHGVPSELPSSALSELSLIDASTLQESNLRTLGFTEEEQDADDRDEDPAVVFDACEGEMDALPALAEYARRMRDLGMQVVALLSGCPDVGFREEPFAEGRRTARCLVWASRVSAGETAAHPATGKAKAYPYVVGLHCQWEPSGQESAPASWVMGDGGEWTAVGARHGAILVTIGDIAQVWSNGKLKKVRGMAHPTSTPEAGQQGEPDLLSVTVLITLCLDSVISPLVPCADAAGEEGREDEADGANGEDEDGWRFRSFLLEDYAWRVYHQRLQFKDPLVRYRT